jgi:hypothetical protein
MPIEKSELLAALSALGADGKKDDDSAFVGELAAAVTSLVEAVKLLGARCDQIEKSHGELAEKSGGFLSNYENEAREAQLGEKVGALKGKYGANLEYGSIAEKYSALKGNDFYRELAEHLMEAEQHAAKAEENAEPYNEEKYVGSIFGGLGEHLKKYSDILGGKPAEVIAEPAEAPKEEAKAEPEAAVEIKAGGKSPEVVDEALKQASEKTREAIRARNKKEVKK